MRRILHAYHATLVRDWFAWYEVAVSVSGAGPTANFATDYIYYQAECLDTLNTWPVSLLIGVSDC